MFCNTHRFLTCAVALTALAAAPAVAQAPTDADLRRMETEAVRIVNEERAKVGAGPLLRVIELDTAARNHAVDMAVNNYFSHTGTGGTQAWDRAWTAGYPRESWYVAEAITEGPSSAQGAIEAWRSSAPHWTGITGTERKEIGIGVAYNPGLQRPYKWVLVMGDGGGTPVIDEVTPAPDGRTPAVTNARLRRMEQRVIALINQNRIQNGLKRLVRVQGLDDVALAHSNDMAANDIVRAAGSNGSTPQSRVQAAGFQLALHSELQAGGFATGDAFLQAVAANPNNRAVFLNANLTQIGIGVAFRAGTKAGYHWTLIVARPR